MFIERAYNNELEAQLVVDDLKRAGYKDVSMCIVTECTHTGKVTTWTVSWYHVN